MSTREAFGRPAVLASTAALVVSLGGCVGADRTSSAVSSAEALRLERGEMAVEFTPSIDRFTYFGPEHGPNLLFVMGADRGPTGDGSYRFFGGAHTWVGPQAGPPGSGIGWVAGDAGPAGWPPDPAMDVGPARRTGWTVDSFSVSGPRLRSGLVEEKTFRVTSDRSGELLFALRNATEQDVPGAGAWITTAADRRGAIAVRIPEGAAVWGWDERSVEQLRTILSAPDSRGWAMLDLGRANWDGGVKVYIAAPAGAAGVPVEIAQWQGGYWLHRSQAALSEWEAVRLRECGEGPVAVFLQPRDFIFEAQLYGPIEPVPALASKTRVERWLVIPAAKADTSVLP